MRTAPDKLQPGTVDVDTTKSTNIAIRKAAVGQDASVLLQGFEIDATSDRSVAEQLRDALSKVAVRVVDLFREWDDDNNGMVSRAEFQRGMQELKFNAPAEEIDALFDSWAPNGSDHLELNELSKLLR